MQFVPYFDRFVFCGVNTAYLCLNYWYKGTLVYCRTRCMKMLSVEFFEITQKGEGIFSSSTSFTRSAFWSDMKSCILRILSVLQACFTRAPFSKKLIIRIALLYSFSISWNNLVLDCPHIWHAYIRWEMNREKYIVFRRDISV